MREVSCGRFGLAGRASLQRVKGSALVTIGRYNGRQNLYRDTYYWVVLQRNIMPDWHIYNTLGTFYVERWLLCGWSALNVGQAEQHKGDNPADGNQGILEKVNSQEPSERRFDYGQEVLEELEWAYVARERLLHSDLPNCGGRVFCPHQQSARQHRIIVLS